MMRIRCLYAGEWTMGTKVRQERRKDSPPHKIIEQDRATR